MSRFFTPKEAVEIRLLANDDLQQRAKLRLLKWSKHVYRDLNLTSIKTTVRRKYQINKRTNTVDLDFKFDRLCSVNIVDRYGVEYPVFRNDRITKDDDIVDVGAAKDCVCEYKCKSQLCNTVKGYEAVIETITAENPNGSTTDFECISRKAVDSQGFFYEQTQAPVRIYENEVWVRTELKTFTNKLCKVEVDEHGCICDTEENMNRICHSCGIENVNKQLCAIGGTADTPPHEGDTTWIYYCSSKAEWLYSQCGGYPFMRPQFTNYYNVSELGDRLIFPPNFGWDHVIVRTYETPPMDDMLIPIQALETFVMGLMYWDCRFNDAKQPLAREYGRNYSLMKSGLLRELNKYTVTELGRIMAPPVFVPSFIIGRTNKYEGSFRNFFVTNGTGY